MFFIDKENVIVFSRKKFKNLCLSFCFDFGRFGKFSGNTGFVDVNKSEKSRYEKLGSLAFPLKLVPMTSETSI